MKRHAHLIPRGVLGSPGRRPWRIGLRSYWPVNRRAVVPPPPPKDAHSPRPTVLLGCCAARPPIALALGNQSSVVRPLVPRMSPNSPPAFLRSCPSRHSYPTDFAHPRLVRQWATSTLTILIMPLVPLSPRPPRRFDRIRCEIINRPECALRTLKPKR